MQAIRRSKGTAISSLKYESTTGSFDCSEEFSLDHWIRVCNLVNESENPDVSREKIDRADAYQKLISEVESTTADEHFARDVV